MQHREIVSGRGAKLHDLDDMSEHLDDHEAEEQHEEPERTQRDQPDLQPAGHYPSGMVMLTVLVPAHGTPPSAPTKLA